MIIQGDPFTGGILIIILEINEGVCYTRKDCEEYHNYIYLGGIRKDELTG